jgi:hypothetical protein
VSDIVDATPQSAGRLNAHVCGDRHARSSVADRKSLKCG